MRSASFFLLASRILVKWIEYLIQEAFVLCSVDLSGEELVLYAAEDAYMRDSL